MKISKGISPITRAVGVFSAVAIVVGGVTFAALNSSATLSDNTLSTADASLKIYDFGTAAFESDAPGFNLSNLVPGAYSDKQLFYFLNDGEGDLTVTASVGDGDATTTADDPVLTGVTAANVKLKFTSNAPGCAADTVETTLALLQAGDVALPCNPLSQGAQGNASAGAEETEGNYSVEFKLANVADEGASVNNLDIVFDGTIGTVPEQVTTL